MKVGDTEQMLVLQADPVGQVVTLFSQSMDQSEIYHSAQTKEQDRTSGVAWKPKIHAKPGETGVESCQRWL